MKIDLDMSKTHIEHEKHFKLLTQSSNHLITTTSGRLTQKRCFKVYLISLIQMKILRELKLLYRLKIISKSEEKPNYS